MTPEERMANLDKRFDTTRLHVVTRTAIIAAIRAAEQAAYLNGWEAAREACKQKILYMSEPLPTSGELLCALLIEQIAALKPEAKESPKCICGAFPGQLHSSVCPCWMPEPGVVLECK